MAWEAKFDGNDGSSEAKGGREHQFYVVELVNCGVTEAGKVGKEALHYDIVLQPAVAEAQRLYVGNLSWDRPAYGEPETGDEVLVGFENGGSDTHHPAFVWLPTSHGPDFI